MATFDGSDLKNLRISKGLSAPDLADLIGEDVNLIRRYEANANKNPQPDTMYQMCVALGDERIWEVWMRTEFPKSYGRVHPEPLPHTLEGAILALYSEVHDLKKLRQKAMEDGADGKIDSDNLREELLKEVNDMLKAAQTAKAILEGGADHGSGA